jgi:DNA-binding LacI/PurR family transcriptional regulator
LLIDAIEGSDRAPRRLILATELIERASSAGRRMP